MFSLVNILHLGGYQSDDMKALAIQLNQSAGAEDFSFPNCSESSVRLILFEDHCKKRITFANMQLEGQL